MLALRLFFAYGFLSFVYGAMWLVRARRLPFMMVPPVFASAMLFFFGGMLASSGVPLARATVIAGATAAFTIATLTPLCYAFRRQASAPRLLFSDFVVRPWPPQVRQRAVRQALFIVVLLAADAIWYGTMSSLLLLLVVVPFALAEWATAACENRHPGTFTALAAKHDPTSATAP